MNSVVTKFRHLATSGSRSQLTTLSSKVPARGYAAAPGEAPKVNCWQAPSDPAKWKEEQVVFAVLGSWAVVITAAFQLKGGKKEPKPQ
ncbi:hypothetical protein WJX74_003635 [Apatococcus lobatus]|uniref:Uncharacterized protein n=1 Tax=Apatococcus lobatus TaxID=904363 RepID=A0AAW1RQZ0_9CHLO